MVRQSGCVDLQQGEVLIMDGIKNWKLILIVSSNIKNYSRKIGHTIYIVHMYWYTKVIYLMFHKKPLVGDEIFEKPTLNHSLVTWEVATLGHHGWRTAKWWTREPNSMFLIIDGC